ncbi:hypothetical protein [Spirosoma validum]|nr:hypothetical protein [Spirosoma validum]
MAPFLPKPLPGWLSSREVISFTNQPLSIASANAPARTPFRLPWLSRPRD